MEDLQAIFFPVGFPLEEQRLILTGIAEGNGTVIGKCAIVQKTRDSNALSIAAMYVAAGKPVIVLGRP